MLLSLCPFSLPSVEACLRLLHLLRWTNLQKEIPTSLEKPLAEAKDKERVSIESDRKDILHEEEREKSASRSHGSGSNSLRLKVGCDELGGKISRRIERPPDMKFCYSVDSKLGSGPTI